MGEDGREAIGSGCGKIFLAGAFLWLAHWVNGVFTELESGARESVRLHLALIVLYDRLGHTGTVAFLAAIGVIALGLGIRQLVLGVRQVEADHR